MSRRATIQRTTKETAITAVWDLDVAGDCEIATGLGFLDHMLDSLARHSRTTIAVSCRGDLHVDGHHVSEDAGIVLGQCLRQALGDRAGLERFGHTATPLDEALVAATVDLSGRPYFACDLAVNAPRLGDWDSELVSEFFRALAVNAQLCLHLQQLRGVNSHHIVEAAFKAFARALRQAIARTGDDRLPSTKEYLA